MNHGPKWILMIVIGVALVSALTYFFVEKYRYNATVASMNEATQVAAFQSLDHSARVEPGEAEITETTFKKVFQSEFEKRRNARLSETSYSYDFLKTESGQFKAVNVKVKDEHQSTFQTTYTADTVKSSE
ncbi:hypothetical protein JKS07_13890 [Listeria monocytogenes]|nr:hypothetical protein [Listeria monocytogenes]